MTEEPVARQLQSPKWIPYDTPNKATLQKLNDHYNEVEAGRLPYKQFIDECEKLLKTDAALQKEPKDVCEVYFLCSYAAAAGRQYSLSAEYSLKRISTLEDSHHKEKRQALAESYLDLSSAYQFANEIDKSIQAARVVIEKYPDAAFMTKGAEFVQPTLKRYDPTTKRLTVMPDTTRKPERVMPHSIPIATFAVSQLARVYSASHREEEGIAYFHQLRQLTPSSEIGFVALVESGNLQLQKKNFAEVKAIRQQLQSDMEKCPSQRQRVEQTLRRWDRIEENGKKLDSIQPRE